MVVEVVGVGVGGSTALYAVPTSHVGSDPALVNLSLFKHHSFIIWNNTKEWYKGITRLVVWASFRFSLAIIAFERGRRNMV